MVCTRLKLSIPMLLLAGQAVAWGMLPPLPFGPAVTGNPLQETEHEAYFIEYLTLSNAFQESYSDANGEQFRKKYRSSLKSLSYSTEQWILDLWQKTSSPKFAPEFDRYRSSLKNENGPEMTGSYAALLKAYHDPRWQLLIEAAERHQKAQSAHTYSQLWREYLAVLKRDPETTKAFSKRVSAFIEAIELPLVGRGLSAALVSHGRLLKESQKLLKGRVGACCLPPPLTLSAPRVEAQAFSTPPETTDLNEILKLFRKAKGARKTEYVWDGGVSRFRLEANPKSPGMMKRATIFKEILGEAYDGPRTEDFQQRVAFLKEVALDQCQEKPECLQAVGKLEQDSRELLWRKARIPWRKVREEIKTLNPKAYQTGSFYPAYKQALGILRSYTYRLAEILSQHRKQKISQKDLYRLESHYLASKPGGRENLIHLFDVGTEKQKTRSQYLSLHVPFSSLKTTPPSSDRLRGGLANAVLTSFYKQDGTEQLFSAYRHSVYSPIYMKSDEYLRRAEASDNLRAVLGQLVEDWRQKDSSRRNQCPASLRLSTAMLVTPFRFALPGQGLSEINQLRETYAVSRMFDGRLVDLSACEKPVQIFMTFVNVEANKEGSVDQGGLLGKWFTPSVSFKERMNARGILQYHRDVKDHLNELLETLKKQNLERTHQELLVGMADLASLYQEESDEMESRLLRIRNLELQAQLPNRYAQLEKLQQRYKEVSESQKADSHRKVLRALAKGLRELEDEIRHKEEALAREYAQVISELRKSNARERVQEKEKSVLIDLRSSKIQENKNLLEYRDLLKLFSEGQELYLSGNYRLWKHKLDFQRNFLIVNYKMGNPVNFFCKSAEDRTGRLNIKIESALVFRDLYGYFPSLFDEADLKSLHSIEGDLYYKSVSRDTAGANNPGARGLQSTLVTGMDYPDDVIRTKMDRDLAKLARSSFDPPIWRFGEALHH